MGDASTIIGNTMNKNGYGIQMWGFSSLAGSSVVHNTIAGNQNGVLAFCPSSLIGNAIVNNTYGNLSLTGFGCNSIDNLAP
jgi:hypothetical protein